MTAVGEVMKYVATQSGRFLTGTELADAVQNYGVALDRAHQLALVEIPVIEADGRGARATFAVGWSAGTATITAPDESEELTEVDTVIGLYEKAAAAGVIRAHPFSPDEVQALSWPLLDNEYDRD
jgi:hypothetical protein